MTGNKSGGENGDPRTEWEKSAGLASETTSAQIYPTRRQKQQWKQEAGSQSLSGFIIERVEEARLQNEYGSTENQDTAENDRVEELEEEVERLEQELEQARQHGETGDGPGIEFDGFVLDTLSSEPQGLDEILEELASSGALNQLVKREVEDRLYDLASQGEIRFNRSAQGWKLAEPNQR